MLFPTCFLLTQLCPLSPYFIQFLKRKEELLQFWPESESLLFWILYWSVFQFYCHIILLKAYNRYLLQRWQSLFYSLLEILKYLTFRHHMKRWLWTVEKKEYAYARKYLLRGYWLVHTEGPVDRKPHGWISTWVE